MRLDPAGKTMSAVLSGRELNMDMGAIGWVVAVVFLLPVATTFPLRETVRERILSVTSRQPRIRIQTNIHRKSMHMRIVLIMASVPACDCDLMAERLLETVKRSLHLRLEITF